MHDSTHSSPRPQGPAGSAGPAGRGEPGETAAPATADTQLVQSLIDWFDEHARPLPWRGEDAGNGPWAVFVSEVMSQQTPIARVEPVWREWMRRWPTPAAVAAATPAQVLRAWDRLGYPRRALRLQEAARIIDTDWNGHVPADEHDLRRLPGVGSYTAAAVRAFAYGRRSVVLDTNIRRVLGRVRTGTALPRPHQTRAEYERAAALVPTDDARAAQWNAAVMEFGALICTATKPACGQCPLAYCAWQAADFPPDEHQRTSQSWAGSDRQMRGRIMAQLRAHPTRTRQELISSIEDSQQLHRALASLVADGLVSDHGSHYQLPS